MVDSSTYGSKMPRANWDYIGSIPLPLPPLETQTAIASYLDAKCELIAKYISDKTKIINLLREQKKSLIYNAVTGKIMIKLNGDTVVASTVSAITTPSQNSVAATTVSPSRSNPTTTYKPTNIPWLGDIPTDWVVRRLKGVLKNLTDGSHISVKSVNEGYPYITVTNIDQKTRNIDLVNCQKISLKDYEQLVKNGCKPDIGDVLFSQIGTIGLTVEVKLNSDFVMLSSLAILKPNANQISNSFLIYTLLSDLIIQQYSLAMAGGAVKRITLNHISQFQIPLPPLQTQHQIVAYLDTQTAIIDNTITKIQKEIELIQEYKKSLIYNAVTGKKLIYT